eukprot:11812054-Heterocapsa_arctica.AAC.1
MEIDTEDTEVLKNRFADKTVAFDHLEGIIAGLRAEYAAQTQVVETFGAARVTADAQIIVQRESALVDKMTTDDLKRKCEESDHDR